MSERFSHGFGRTVVAVDDGHVAVEAWHAGQLMCRSTYTPVMAEGIAQALITAAKEATDDR